ncbi:MAG: hypothetical protein SFZ02_02210 [bacterium]|nr:hypothetical protein [bacterium]
MLSSTLFSCTSTDDKPQQVACESVTDTQLIADGWRFQVDSDDEGITENWYAPTYDDSSWRDDVPAGMAWENKLGDFDGIGWYRTTITLPNWDAVWLAISGLDDIGEVWVNGISAHVWEQISDRATFINLRDYDENAVTIAFRVVDTGVYGGLKDPIRIGADYPLATSSELYMKWLADTHPTWQLPSWTRGGALSWTMTGALNATDEALVSNDGAVVAWARAPIAQAWIYNPQTETIIPIKWTFGLVSGDLPLPQWWADQDGLWLFGSLIHDAETNSIQWQFKAQNNTDIPYQILVTVLPFAVNRSNAPIYAISAKNNTRVWVNNTPYMTAQTAPETIGVGRIADVMDGKIPAQAELGCIPTGDGAVIMRYPLNGGTLQELQFAFPPSPNATAFASTEKPFWKVHGDAEMLWRDQLSRVTLRLPDSRIQAAANASLAYLQIATDPNGVHPGPLAHNAVWVRDTAYIGLALLQAGYSDIVKNFIPNIYDEQTPEGKIPPIQGEDAPWLDDEWDSQGQAIFLVTSYYRYTRDLETLRDYYPKMRLAGEFIRDLRANYSPENPSARGLLPPSLSAEDLGPKDQHYYWDNLWAIIGLRELAYASDILGEADSDWATAEADSINQAILDSVESLLGENPPYLPVSVEELGTPAMARGSVPMIYPSNAFKADEGFIQRSFQYYFDQWVKPNGGGYVHREGQFWTYGGLELAHAFLRVGMESSLHDVLGWTLSNQTLNGVYAWAEQVSPAGLGFTGGDMPHAWASASFYTLARTMVLWEDGNVMRLFTLAPSWWFEDGREVVANNLPTMYGDMTIRTTTDVTMTDNGWRGTLRLSYTLNGELPAEGMMWRLPYAPSNIRTVNGATYADGILTLPAVDDVIVLEFGG